MTENIPQTGSPEEPKNVTEQNVEVSAESAPEQAASAPQEVKTDSSGHGGRKVAITLLVLLGLILLLVGNVTLWARYTLLNTDGWVNAVGPITQDPAVAQTISTFVVGELDDVLNVDQAMTEILPTEFQLLAAPLSNALEGLIEETITVFIQSDVFNTVWVTANRAVHTVVIGVLTGGGDYVYLESGQLVVDFSDAVNSIKSTFGLDEMDLDIAGDGGRIVLFENQQVAVLQEAISYLKTFSWLLPLLSLSAFALAVFVSLWRRKTLLWTGIGVALTMGLALILFSVVEAYAMVSISEPLIRELGRAIWDVVTNGLVTQTILLGIIGVVIAIVAWQLGPNSWYMAWHNSRQAE